MSENCKEIDIDSSEDEHAVGHNYSSEDVAFLRGDCVGSVVKESLLSESFRSGDLA